MNALSRWGRVTDDICRFGWRSLCRDEMIGVVWAYYFFSIQFRENLSVARRLYPDDRQLRELEEQECDTDNLSPWPDVARPGERMHHDEFIRRLLARSPLGLGEQARLEAVGRSYLATIGRLGDVERAASIASYENSGLERVFRAILSAPEWDDPVLRGFRHFLRQHIRFDADPEHGHGALCRHLPADDRVLPLWTAFKELLVAAVPGLDQPAAKPS